MAACFQSCKPPEPLNWEISIYFQNSVLKIDMNIVITGPGDINVKEIINFDLYKSDYEQKQYNIPLRTGIAKHFYLVIRTHLSEFFWKILTRFQ